MTRNHKILTGVLIAAVIASGGAATYRYVTRPKVAPAPTVAQVKAQDSAAIHALTVQKAVDDQNVAQLTNSNQQLTAQKTQACASLAKYRVIAPECK